jgi:outer membrane assembly lipoprotein YfiO
MKPNRLTILLSIYLMTLIAAPSADAAWVWSPQTGWIGPGGAVKDSPEEQLAFAVGFFDRKDYDRARKEFRKLLNAYKNAPEAPEAQYYLGRCEEEDADYYKAFLEYRKTVQVYPSTRRFDEILEREFQIGNYFLAGKKRKIFGTAAILPARDKAVEVFEAIAQDGPFSEHGQLAQYKLGLSYLALEEYEQAVSAFEQVIARYPDSPLVDDTRYQIAIASLKGTFSPGYDQSPTDRAVQELTAFVRSYPASDLLADATNRLKELQERRAEHEYLVAAFYERQKHPESALIYYRTIVDRYAETAWAAKAAARLEVLDNARL